MGRPAIVYTEEELNRPTKAIWIIKDATSSKIAKETFLNNINELLEIDNRKKVLIVSDNPIDGIKDIHHAAISAFSLGTVRRVDFRNDSEEKAIKSINARLKNGIIIVMSKLSDESLGYIYDARQYGNDVIFFKSSLLPNTWEHENVFKPETNLKFIIYARPSFQFIDENIKNLEMFYQENSISLICAQYYVTFKYAEVIARFNEENSEMELMEEMEKPEFKQKLYESFVYDLNTGAIYNYALQDDKKFDEVINTLFPAETGFALNQFKKDFLIIPQIVEEQKEIDNE